MSLYFISITNINLITYIKLSIHLLIIALFYLFFIPRASASEVWVKNPSNPIISPGSSGEWDESFVYPGTVIREGTTYKMWYTGSNSERKEQVGYATSTNGINWTKYDHNPVLSVGENLSWDDKITSQADVLFDNGTYHMWYSGNDDVVEVEHWQIGHATSSDGINWTKDSLNPILSKSQTGWDNKSVYQPAVQKVNGKFLMWFSATKNGASEPRWKLGLATSENGIKWDKYSENPVMIADNPWEQNIGDGIGSPHVFYEKGIFHLWYHTNGIGYAQSIDGINWTKYENNPVLQKGSSSEWDKYFIVIPKVIKDISNYKMWYGGEDARYNFKIGLAEATELPEILPPPPPPESPIVIIPGLGASWNENDILSCKLENSGNWEMAPFVKVYDPLKHALADQGLEIGKDFEFYFYDWRQPLEVQVDKFKDYLDELLTHYQAGSKIRLVGHSLGGLLIRGYLEKYPNSKKIYKAMTVGSPHQGSVDVYPLWEAGDTSWIGDKNIKSKIIQLLTFCRFKISPSPRLPQFNEYIEIPLPGNIFKSTREIVQSLAPIIKTLLPTFNYLKLKGTEIEIPDMVHQNDWVLLHPFPAPVYRELTHTLSGSNRQTLRYINIEKPKKNKNGNWADGKPKSKVNTSEGDDTVLNMSSQINGINNIVIDGSHNQIIFSQDGIAKIFEFLGIEKAAVVEAVELPEEKAETVLSLMSEGEVKMTLTDPEKQEDKSEDNLIIKFDPKTGNYLLNLKSDKDETVLLNVNFIDKTEEENTFTYKIRLRKDKESKFRFNLNPKAKKKIRLSLR